MATFYRPEAAEESPDELDGDDSFSLQFKEDATALPGASEIISADSFREKCKANNLIFSQPDINASDEAIFKQMGVSVDKGKEIQATCDSSQLLQTKVILEEASQLQSIQNPKNTLFYLDKHSSINFSNVFQKERHGDQDLPTKPRVPHDEVIFSVDIYHPVKQSRDQNFLLLASQELTQLRDKIVCLSDYLCLEESSTDPFALMPESEGQRKPTNTSKSAFFFISNTFYDDKRDPEYVDSSSRITAWVEERIGTSPYLDQFSSVDMEGVTFGQLNLRLGYPYLYCHHGNCEHLVLFRAMQLFNPKCDPSFLEDYPRLLYCNRIKKQSCRTCKNTAAWLTCDDELAAESPCFFCQGCFEKLHYTIDGKKACRFRAYRYRVPDLQTLPS